jgi:hypothetical protein
MYMLQLMDNYAATYSVLIIGLTECVVISWIYGKSKKICINSFTLGTVSFSHIVGEDGNIDDLQIII